MALNLELLERKIEEKTLNSLSLSKDIEAFKKNEENDYNINQDKLIKAQEGNKSKNKTAMTIATIAAVATAGVGFSLPIIATGIIGMAIPLLRKDKYEDVYKEKIQQINDFNSKEKPINELVLSDEFQYFQKQNDTDYIKAKNKTSKKNTLAEFAVVLTGFPAIAGGFSVLALGATATSPLLIASLVGLAASTMYALKVKKEDAGIDKEFGQKFTDEFTGKLNEFDKKVSQVREKALELMNNNDGGIEIITPYKLNKSFADDVKLSELKQEKPASLIRPLDDLFKDVDNRQTKPTALEEGQELLQKMKSKSNPPVIQMEMDDLRKPDFTMPSGYGSTNYTYKSNGVDIKLDAPKIKEDIKNEATRYRM